MGRLIGGSEVGAGQVSPRAPEVGGEQSHPPALWDSEDSAQTELFSGKAS